MEKAGLRQSDFAAVLGSAFWAPDFPNLKRSLTLSTIQRIHRKWRLSASVLIEPYHLEDIVALDQSVAGQSAPT